MSERFVTVTDRQGHPYRVRCCVDENGILLLARDGLDGVRVGDVTTQQQEEGWLLLGSILIEGKVHPRPRTLCQKLRYQMGLWHPKPVSYRNRGLGGALLKLLLAEADRVGVACIRGSLVEGDLRRWSGLADWYRKHGFQILPPQPWTCRGAVHGIERRRDTALDRFAPDETD